MNTLHLIGSEAVERAGCNISSAAEQISRAASTFECTAERLIRSLDDHAMRVSGAVDQVTPKRRRVMVYESKNIAGTSKYETHEKGYAEFHCWGVEFEEFENGTGNCTVAIVEFPGGTVHSVFPRFIRFEVAA